ncbi:MAG: GAP family protein [Solirubrobacterales bacterium]
MLAALSFLLPLSLGGAVSPMMLTEQTVLLAGSGGRPAAKRYALGVVLTLLLIVVALVFFGHVISLPTEPKLSASLDLALGAGLLCLAAAIEWIGRHPIRRPSRRTEGAGARRSLSDRPEAAFPFGVFSMATNFTTLAIVVVAAKEIAGADLGTADRIALIAVLVTVCSVPAWLPLAVTRIAPRTGDAALERLHSFIDDHGRTAVVLLLVAAGLFLVGRGLVDLI